MRIVGIERSSSEEGFQGEIPLGIEVDGDPNEQASINLSLWSGRECLWEQSIDVVLPASGRDYYRPIVPPLGMPWSPERPVLYDLNLGVNSDGVLSDEQRVLVGFTRAALTDGRIHLHGMPWFLHALRAGEDGMRDSARLCLLAAQVHADCLACTVLPSEPLLDQCDRQGVIVLAHPDPISLQGVEEHSPTHEAPEWTRRTLHASFPPIYDGTSLSHFESSADDFSSREKWAAALHEHVHRARASSAAGGVVIDAEPLLDDPDRVMAWHVGCCYRRLESPESRILLPAWDPQTLIPLESALVATSISDLEISWELLDGTRVAARGRGTGSNNPPGAAIRIASAPQQWQGQPGTRIHISLPSEQSPAARQEPTGRVLVVQRSSRPAIQLEERSPKPIRGNEGRLQGGPGPTVPLSGAGREIATLQFPLEIQAPIGCALSASPSLTTLGRGARVSTELSNRTSTAINSEIRLTLHPASGTSATVSTTRMLLAPGASERFETSIRAIDLPRGASYVLAGIQSPLGVEIRSCLIHRTTGKAAWIRYKNESAESTRFWDGGISELPGGPISFVSLAGLEEIAIPRPVPNTIPVDREDDHARLAAPAVGMLATATLDGIQADTFTKTAAENQGVMLYRKEWGRLPQSVGSSLEWTAYPGGLVRAQWRIGSPELCEIRNNELSLRISTPESWDQVVWNRAALWDHYPRNHPDAIEGTTSFPVQLSDVVRAVFKGTRGCMALLTGSDRLNLAAEPSWLTIRLPISASEGLSGSLRVEFGFFPLQDPDAAAGLWAWKPSFVSVYPADA